MDYATLERIKKLEDRVTALESGAVAAKKPAENPAPEASK